MFTAAVSNSVLSVILITFFISVGDGQTVDASHMTHVWRQSREKEKIGDAPACTNAKLRERCGVYSRNVTCLMVVIVYYYSASACTEVIGFFS